MSKRRLRYMAAAAFLIAGGAIWFYLHHKDGPEFQKSRIQKGSIEATISATGNCNAVVTVQVGSQVSGNIKALYADFNTKVKKGQLVALIDPELFQAKLNQAQANLEAARASVVNAQAQVQKAIADMASARANLENLKANIAKAKVAVIDGKSKLDHRLELFKQGILSSEDRDTAQATYDSAVAAQEASKAMYDAGEESVKSAQAQLDVARTQLSSAQAQVKQNAAALSQAQLDLDHTKITAPVEGTVVARRMDVGQTVAASFQAPTIFEIAQDLTKMQVDTNVDEADVGKVRVGQPASFTVDAYPNQTFSGVVSQIRQAPINVQNVITYDVVIGVDNPDLRIYPGMTANVHVLTDKREDVLRLPNSALRVKLALKDDARDSAAVRSVFAAGKQKPQKAMSTIYLLGDDGKPRPVRVQLGIGDGQFTEVTGDIHEGDTVITGTLQKNRTAAPVTAAPRGRGPGF